MKPLETPHSHYLLAAEGWLELGNPAEAQAELDQIPPGLQTHPDVLGVRWHLHAHARQWSRCVTVANAVILVDEARSEAWIHRSFALHELKQTLEAYEQLLPAAGKFPEVWLIPYNLACYCAQLGQPAQSLKWLQRALAIDEPSVRLAAEEDPDLEPLRESLGGDLWKKLPK